jgi:hypothetical protein
VLVLVLAGLGGLVPGPLPGVLSAPSAVAASGPGAQPVPAGRVAVLIDTLEPAAPQPSDVLRVSGTVINRAAERFDDAQISLHLGPPVADRAALAKARSDTTPQPLANQPARLADGVLEPDARVPFTLTVPADALLTRGPGVYPMQVTIVGRTTEGLRDLGRADTFLPYVPVGGAGSDGAAGTGGTAGGLPAEPLPIAWMLPLTDRPRLAGNGGVTDEELAASLAPGGRLNDLLAAATSLPAATVVVDPALLRAVEILADDDHPGVGADRTTPGLPADPDARAWLARLKGAVAAGNGRVDVVPLAFADADLEMLLHAGAGDLARQLLARGNGVVRDALDTRVGVGEFDLPALAVPPAGRVDAAGAELLTGAGATHALLAPSALEAGAPEGGSIAVGTDGAGTDGTGTGTGTGTTGAGAALTPVVPDVTLDGLLRAGPTSASTPRAAEQAVLAELAQTYLSGGGGTAVGGRPAPVVLAPGNDWDPGGSWASRLTADTARYPWLRPVGLPEVVQDTGATAGRGAELSYPEDARAAELPATVLPPVTDTLAAVGGFAEALPAGQTVTRPVTETALSALSAAWRGDPAASAERRASADRGLEQLRGSVRAVASPEITLTSRNGRLPVTLENNLPEAVDVTLRLTSLDRSRVQSDTSVSRVIQPGQKVQVEVEVTATSAGTFPVRLVLLTPTGRPMGPPQQVLIRSTAAGVVAIGVTVAALGVLVLAVAVRALRALLRRRRRSTAPGDAGRPVSTPDRVSP